MENFGENFKAGKQTKPCPVCKESEDTQSHSYQCKVVAGNISINGDYKAIFTNKIDKKVAGDIERIVKFREGYLEK